MYNILIADDHPLFRSGLTAVLGKSTDINIVAECGDGQNALENIKNMLPHFAILDIEMPQMSGVEVAKEIKLLGLATKVILLTMHKDKFYFDKAMTYGVKGYLLKDSATEEIMHCINELANGNTYTSPNLAINLIEDNTKLNDDQIELLKTLTPTEKTIIKLIGDGKNTSVIATMLFVSVKTVEAHRNNINKKLKLDGAKNALLKFALLYHTQII